MRLRAGLGSTLAIMAIGVTTAHASGFALPALSVTGLSEANALIANTSALGAEAYNPAAMAFHKGGYDLGLIGLAVHSTVTPAGGAGTVVATTPHWQTIPDVYWADKVAPRTRLGFAINEPYGFAIAWPASTFPALAQGTAAALAPTYSELRLFDVSPSVSYRMGGVAVDLGIDYYDAHRVVLGTPTTTVSGSGDRVGGHIGFLARLGSWGIGANYRSAVNVPLDGTFSQSGAQTPMNAVLHLPWQAGIGVHDALNPRTGIEIDVARIGWSRFTDLTATPPPAVGGATLFSSSYDWRSAMSYRLGVHYDLSHHVSLRAGYGYDQAAATNAHFSARLPDANSQELSFGASQKLGTWRLSAGYMYVYFNTRSYNSGTSLATSDPNGTSAYNGTYRTHAQLFGISISRQFS